MSKKEIILESVRLGKLVHGGQCLAESKTGKKIFVWGGLPGELVDIQITKSKKQHSEGFVSKVIEPSTDRITTLDKTDIEMSIAPWSIMSYGAELASKAAIINETFKREGVDLHVEDIETEGSLSAYRNKVEFSFWGDEDGLHFAHYLRASHQKIKLKYPYNPLIPDQMSIVAGEILDKLNALNVRAGDIKSLMLRCDRKNPEDSKVVAALFVKIKDFPKVALQNTKIIYSNPKSPASVVTEVLHTIGDTTLIDTIGDHDILYDVLSFFQVNIPIFEKTLQDIVTLKGDNSSVDMYSGVGSIGVVVGSGVVVESDPNNIEFAKQNVAHTDTKVVHAKTEEALEYIDSSHNIILDPPRAGLHKEIVNKILEQMPPKVIYLSCNPSTQARDVSLLSEKYKITFAKGYNFFPRTPHIESLIVLELQ